MLETRRTFIVLLMWQCVGNNLSPHTKASVFLFFISQNPTEVYSYTSQPQLFIIFLTVLQLTGSSWTDFDEQVKISYSFALFYYDFGLGLRSQKVNVFVILILLIIIPLLALLPYNKCTSYMGSFNSFLSISLKVLS